jgi:hypothetical protein
MNINPKPYVGITGFKTPIEVRQVADLYRTSGFVEGAPYAPMFGVLSSTKRLEDPDSEGARSPSVNQLRAVFSAVPSYALPVLHYHTQNRKMFGDELFELFGGGMKLYSEGLCQAVQLNIAWPSFQELDRVRRTLKRLQVVLQINAKMMRNSSLETLIWGTSAYNGLAEHVLIDASGGKGKPLDSAYTGELLAGLSEEMPLACIGIAGGLSGQNLQEVVSLLRKKVKKPFSVDAEGKLRTDDNALLNLTKTHSYLQMAADALLPQDKQITKDCNKDR